MTPQQIRDAQTRMVRASLVLLSEDRTTRHAIHTRAGTKPCPACGTPKSFLWCSRCFVESHS